MLCIRSGCLRVVFEKQCKDGMDIKHGKRRVQRTVKGLNGIWWHQEIRSVEYLYAIVKHVEIWQIT